MPDSIPEDHAMQVARHIHYQRCPYNEPHTDQWCGNDIEQLAALLRPEFPQENDQRPAVFADEHIRVEYIEDSEVCDLSPWVIWAFGQIWESHLTQGLASGAYHRLRDAVVKAFDKATRNLRGELRRHAAQRDQLQRQLEAKTVECARLEALYYTRLEELAEKERQLEQMRRDTAELKDALLQQARYTIKGVGCWCSDTVDGPCTNEPWCVDARKAMSCGLAELLKETEG